MCHNFLKGIPHPKIPPYKKARPTKRYALCYKINEEKETVF
jgi:hypothetical protein